jgi:hypothetical protein
VSLVKNIPENHRLETAGARENDGNKKPAGRGQGGF